MTMGTFRACILPRTNPSTGGSGPYLAAKSSLATCTFRRFSAVLLPAQKLLSLVSR